MTTGLTVKALPIGPMATELRQLESPYLIRERAFANDPTKHKHRKAIVRSFLKALDPAAQVHCLSLPSYHWSFERLIEDARPDATFVGIERNRTVLDESVPYMPGFERHRYSKMTALGQIEGWSSTKTKHLWMSMGDFIALRRQDVQASEHKRERARWKNFANRFRRFSCAWLDFQSCINGEVETALRWLPGALDARIPVVPVAVTVMKAREQTDVTARINVFGGRVEYIKALIGISGFREVTRVRRFEYASPTGTPMLLTIMHLALAHRHAQTFTSNPGGLRSEKVSP